MIYLRNFTKTINISQAKKLPVISPLCLSYNIHYTFFTKQKNALIKEFTDKVNSGLSSLQEGNYDLSMKYFHQAIDGFTQTRGTTPFDPEEHTMLLRAHYELGRLYERKERYIESLDHFTTALDLTKTSASKFNIEQGDIHNSIGRVYLKQGKSCDLKAKSHFSEARDIFKQLAASNQLRPDLLNNEYMKHILGGKEEQKQAEKTLEMLESLVENRRDIPQGFQEDGNMAYVFLNIGDNYLSLSDSKNALVNWNRGLDIIATVYGQGSSQSIEYYHSICQSLLRAGKTEEARAYLEESLEICKANLSEDHTNLAECYLMGGFLEFRAANFDKAIENFDKGLTVLTKFPDKYFGEIWIGHLTMAEIFLTQGNHAQAKETFDKANHTIVKLLGRSHPEVAGYYLYWADLWKYRANDKEEAKPFYYRALDIYLRSGNIQDSKIIDIYYEIGPDVFTREEYVSNFVGTLCFQQQKYQESAENFLRSIAISEAKGNLEGELELYCQHLGQAFEKKGVLGKATTFYEKAIDLTVKSRGKDNDRVRVWLRHLQERYMRLGKEKEVVALLQKYN